MINFKNIRTLLAKGDDPRRYSVIDKLCGSSSLTCEDERYIYVKDIFFSYVFCCYRDCTLCLHFVKEEPFRSTVILYVRVETTPKFPSSVLSFLHTFCEHRPLESGLYKYYLSFGCPMSQQE
jgi:hypothetical protein